MPRTIKAVNQVKCEQSEMQHRAPLVDAGRQRRKQSRDDFRLPAAMPGAEMAASPAHRQTGFDPHRRKQPETDRKCAEAVRRRFDEKHDCEHNGTANSDYSEKGGRLDKVNDWLKRAGIPGWHR